jgi:hypothetical protein
MSPLSRIWQLATLTIAVAASLLAAVAASAPQARAADPVAITQGGLDWGLKESWRAYIGDAGTTIAGGAARNPDGTFHFPVVSGSYDEESKATEIQLGGSLRFEAHCETTPCVLDITVAEPRLLIDDDGATLFAKVTGNGGTGAEVAFAQLTIDDVEPAIAGGGTTWSAIPTTMSSEGASVFTYPAGTALDPLTFSYTGPGGKPLPEQWTAPGTPLYAAGAWTAAGTGSVDGALADSTHDEIYVSTQSPTAVKVLDAATLAVKGGIDGIRAADVAGMALDPASRTLFVQPNNNELRVLRWDGTAFATLATLVVPNVRFISSAYEPASKRLYVLGQSSKVFTIQGDELDNWSLVSEGTVAGAVLVDLALGHAGKPIATRNNATIVELDLSGETIVTTEIPGTSGYARVVPATTGSFYLYSGTVASVRLLRLVSGGGYALEPDPVFIDAGLSGKRHAAAIVDLADDTLHLGQLNPLSVIRNGQLVRKITLPLPDDPAAATFQGPRAVVDGTLYGSVGFNPGSVQRLVRYDVPAVSPAIAANPANASVSLTGAQTSAPASFTASATGTPAPTVQWQARPAGAGPFADLPGETATTLEVDATAADEGTRYRAVFTNQGGALATSAATLAVKTPPGVDFLSEDVTAVEGATATLQVRPTGNPYPDIQWQRLDGGDWVDLDGETDGFLSVADVAIGQSGSQYRAKLTNELDTVYSDAIALTVRRQLAEAVDLTGGSLVWGVKQSFRNYISSPIAHGAYTACGGAAIADDETFAFRFVSGHYDQAAGQLTAAFGGTVRFTGHDSGLGPALELRLSDPRIEIDGDAGTLFATVQSKPNSGGAPLTSYGEVALAELDLTDVDPTPGVDERFTWTAIPSVLTAAGKQPFADFYSAGTALDPATFEAYYGSNPDPAPESEACPEPKPDPKPEPKPDPKPDPEPKKTPAKGSIAAVKATQVVDGKRRAAVAKLSCPKTHTCRITVPKQAKVKIGGKRYTVAVLAPKTIRPGGRATVRVRLPKAAAKRLAGRRAIVKLKLTIAGRGVAISRTVKVTIRRPSLIP